MAAPIVALNEPLQCIVCQKPGLIKDLPCHHSFCKECLDDMLEFQDDGCATLTCSMKCGGSVSLNQNETTISFPNKYPLKSIDDRKYVYILYDWQYIQQTHDIQTVLISMGET